MASIASYFQLKKRGTTVGTEVRAGVTTFLVMAYIIFVNANTVSQSNAALSTVPGVPSFLPVAVATALAAGVLTIAMGLVANYPFALAAGLGLNSTVAYGLILGKGLPWDQAMAVIFWEGVLITVLVLTGFRQAILEAIPLQLKRAIAVGIGLFIMIIGLNEGGIVVNGPTPLTLGSLTTPAILTFIIGLVIALVLTARKVKGSLLFSIVGATVAAVILNNLYGQDIDGPINSAGFLDVTAKLPSDLSQLIFNFNAENFSTIGKPLGAIFTVWQNGVGALSVALAVFTLMLSDFFDTAGTMVGLGERAGLTNSKGQLPGSDKVLLVDSLAAAVGGAFGVSSNTTYIESAAGIEEGGRTGLTSVVTGLLFLAAIVIAPVSGIVPAQATAPALVLVGFLMFQVIKDIEWKSVVDGFPILVTIVMMPFTYSITTGIGLGFVTYGFLKVVTGSARDVKPLMWVSIIGFLVYFALPYLQATLGF
jgi:AGZA family xanthine/uracil permease-like MFS transporter